MGHDFKLLKMGTTGIARQLNLTQLVRMLPVVFVVASIEIVENLNFDAALTVLARADRIVSGEHL